MKKTTFLLINALVICCFQGLFGQGTISTFSFKSTSLNQDMSYNVYLPPSYNQNSTAKYPVLYLFHGKGGRYFDWANNAGAAATLNTEIANGAKEMVVIMPDGIDEFYNNVGKQWESYMYDELIPAVESTFRVGTNKQNRAVAGLSMGGWGTTYYWIKYGPEMYSSAYCMSGALGIRDGIDLKVMIESMTNEEKKALPPYSMEIGTEDHLYNLNVEWNNFLNSHEIQHAYLERAGVHDWAFWTACLPKAIRFASDNFDGPLSAPETYELPLRGLKASIYPNPAEGGFIYINCGTNTKQFNISLYDLQGKVGFSDESSIQDKHFINIANLNKGIYFVRIHTDTEWSVQKLIIR
ncbi:MAG: T9SS type A sorting domain-containing protein [Bacteroidales bacterium]|nr:T9SS type A sorting domain-containing protein [Bacteroidales bacterium]